MLASLRRLPKIVRASTNGLVHRNLATQTFTSQFVKQGGLLHCDLSNLEKCELHITSKWQDHCDVTYDEDDMVGMEITEHQEENEIAVRASSALQQRACKIEVTVPEYLDIVIDGNHLDLIMSNKIQGNVNITCKSGNVTADKLRGEALNFTCGEADITIKKLLEGTSVIQCRSLQAKMINGESTEICAGTVSIDALYCTQTNIEATDNVTVGLSRGMIEATSTRGNVSVSNIDGAFDVTAEHGSVKLQINTLVPFTTAPASASAVHEADKHSTSDQHQQLNQYHQGAESRASAPKGHITATVDPELAANIHCRSDSGGLQRMCVTLTSDAFELAPHSTQHSYEYDMDVRTPQPGTWQGTCISGRLTGKSAGTKRPTFLAGNSSSGKIDLTGAEAQALDAGGMSLQDTTTSTSERSGSAAATDVGSVQSMGDCDITLVARGNVRVETMSWIQVIRSKYGFEDSKGTATGARGTVAPVGVGRTASATVVAAEIARLALDK